MDKLKLETPNMTEKNIENIAKIFPNVMTETKDDNGEIKKVVDFDKLKQELSDYVIEGDESYDFTWVGKRESMLEANKPIRKTLRPDRESSIDWENTQNIYIEGDNLDALKLLQESYLGKIKMIYIDPPYNTGKDFVYKDNFTQSLEEYNEEKGLIDNEGNKLFQNTESNGRFHSDWCSMIYPRLKLARNLLTDNGVIFISIDDNEITNIRKMCDEIFGINNFITQFTRKGSGGRQDSKYYAIVHEYILCYAKNSDNFISGKELKTDVNYPFYDEEKQLHYKTQLLRKWGENSRRSDRPNLYYPITDPDGNEHFPMISPTEESCWRWGKEKMFQEIQNGKVEFKKKNDEWIAYEKIYEPTEDNPDTKLYTSIIDDVSNSTGASLLKTLFNDKIFDYPKPVDLIIKILKLGNFTNNDIILDFFSGSATTAHAVMQLNAEDSGNRKFIMVQLPETTAETSEAYKAGYKNICEIGKERIRRAGKKIKEEIEQNNAQLKLGEEPKKVPDIGFRVFKVDDTNMNDVYYAPKDYNKSMLEQLTSNIKDDRTDEDLLYGVLLDWGVELSLPHKVEIVDNKKVHIVNDNELGADLIACFEQNISENVVREIAKKQPTRVVFRDNSFNTDDHKINVEEIFKLLAPNTTVKVI